MVARTKQQDGEELVVTLTDARGDLLRVTVPQPDGGDIHQPRETD